MLVVTAVRTLPPESSSSTTSGIPRATPAMTARLRPWFKTPARPTFSSCIAFQRRSHSSASGSKSPRSRQSRAGSAAKGARTRKAPCRSRPLASVARTSKAALRSNCTKMGPALPAVVPVRTYRGKWPSCAIRTKLSVPRCVKNSALPPRPVWFQARRESSVFWTWTCAPTRGLWS